MLEKLNLAGHADLRWPHFALDTVHPGQAGCPSSIMAENRVERKNCAFVAEY
jgi:hypothetical protein